MIVDELIDKHVLLSLEEGKLSLSEKSQPVLAADGMIYKIKSSFLSN